MRKLRVFIKLYAAMAHKGGTNTYTFRQSMEVVQYKIQAIPSNTSYLIELCLQRLELPAGRRMPARASSCTFAQLMGKSDDNNCKEWSVASLLDCNFDWRKGFLLQGLRMSYVRTSHWAAAGMLMRRIVTIPVARNGNYTNGWTNQEFEMIHGISRSS